MSSNERLLKTLKRMVRGYVSLLESARERIIFHGGTCDTVEQMEAGDPYLAEAKAAIALAESAVETAGEPTDEWSKRWVDCLRGYVPCTYGDAIKAGWIEHGNIEPHEWDNRTSAENARWMLEALIQFRDWAIPQIASRSSEKATAPHQVYHCNVCGGDVTFPEGAKPSMSIGPGGKSRGAAKAADHFEPSANWKRANQRTKHHVQGCDCADCILVRSESPVKATGDERG